MLDIDASFGEGGGQLLRSAVALSAIAGIPVRLRQIRARRDKPGLAPQHLAAVKAVAEVCGAQVEGLALHAQTLTFTPGHVRPGNFRFDIGTAGSITLLLQALLPVLLTAAGTSRITVTGGTDVRGAPPLDYLSKVLLPLLHPMGVRARLHVRRRGYFPRGGGEVEIEIQAATLKPLQIDSCGTLTALHAIAHVAHLPASIAERMGSAARAGLAGLGAELQIETRVLGAEESYGPGGALVLWAQTEHSTLGSARVAERGLRAEVLGESAAGELRADLACSAAVDIHAADQILIYTALARGDSRFTVRQSSRHAETAMWLISHFLPVHFAMEAQGDKTAITVSHGHEMSNFSVPRQ